MVLTAIIFIGCGKTAALEKIADGEYQVTVELKGGTGRATIKSPAKLAVEKGKMKATVVWSSVNYDYMIVNEEKYENEAAIGENSTFTIPVDALNEEMTVIADTVAMSRPHEIEYQLLFRIQDKGEE